MRAALGQVGIPAPLARCWPVVSVAGHVVWVPGLGVDRLFAPSPQSPPCSIEVEIESLQPERTELDFQTLLREARPSPAAGASAPDDREVDDL